MASYKLDVFLRHSFITGTPTLPEYVESGFVKSRYLHDVYVAAGGSVLISQFRQAFRGTMSRVWGRVN